jgi:hypothetical protein
LERPTIFSKFFQLGRLELSTLSLRNCFTFSGVKPRPPLSAP